MHGKRVGCNQLCPCGSSLKKKNVAEKCIDLSEQIRPEQRKHLEIPEDIHNYFHHLQNPATLMVKDYYGPDFVLLEIDRRYFDQFL